jgi:hypothetical protein
MNTIEKYNSMDDLTMASAYVENKMVPYYSEIIIKDMISLNYNNAKCKYLKILTFESFHKIDPNTFKKPQNETDYKLTDQVSPVLIIDNNDNVYRVHHLLWQMLTDIISGNSYNKLYGIDSMFPCKINIDNDNEWCIKLVEFVKPKGNNISACICGKNGDKKCGKCKRKMYCSKECQLEDWPNHKKTCM